MAAKTCKILLTSLLILTFLGTSIGQEIRYLDGSMYQQPTGWLFGNKAPQCNNGQCGPRRPNPAPGGCNDGQCGPRSPQRPILPPQATAPLHVAIHKTKSYDLNGGTKHGYATCIKFEDKSYIVSCAHVWNYSNKNFIIVKGAEVSVKIIKTDLEHDICILECPKGLLAMQLSLTPVQAGTRLGMGYRNGIMKGYRGPYITVAGYVKNGDSGGPIFDSNGLVGIIATYEHEKARPRSGITSGPDSTLISALIRSLSESPSSPTPDEPEPARPMVPVCQPVDLSGILDRIGTLEVQITNSDCTGLATDIGTNKKDIVANKKRIDELEQKIKDNVLAIQRIAGAVEITQKEVIAHGKIIGTLEQRGKDVVLRIQRLETSSTASTESSTQSAQKGKLHFRVRFDQSGRVIGVEPQ